MKSFRLQKKLRKRKFDIGKRADRLLQAMWLFDGCSYQIYNNSLKNGHMPMVRYCQIMKVSKTNGNVLKIKEV